MPFSTFTAGSFLSYLWRACGAHGLHSPFVYSLCRQVIQQADREHSAELDRVRNELLANRQVIDIIDFKSGKTRRATVGDVAKSALSQAKFMHMLRLLSNYLQAEVVLETGSSLGLNARSLAGSETVRQVVSIEGSEIIHQLARKTCEGSPKIELLSGNLYDLLEPTLVRYQPEVIFLDADHRSSAIQYCLDKIMTHCPQVRCVVIHDIYWSHDMAAGWHSVVANPAFTLTIDVFQAGLLFPRYPIQKQHFTLRF